MPVIVIGADTPLGTATVRALLQREGEVRAFITDPQAVDRFKALRAKVAIGDISDATHVGGAALNAFSAVLIAEATHDGREMSFAEKPDDVIAGWAEGLKDAGVQRAIWVTDTRGHGAEALLRDAVAELAVLETADLSPGEVGTAVARLDDAERL
ncbi:MAG: hypothetical protein ACE5KX_07705 [Acidimicrobiia bacterium]